MKIIQIGRRGFPKARRKYYELFKVVELRNTFYDIPSIKRAEKTRREAPEDFESTVKARQVITHSYTSPAWKKIRSKY